MPTIMWTMRTKEYTMEVKDKNNNNNNKDNEYKKDNMDKEHGRQ